MNFKDHDHLMLAKRLARDVRHRLDGAGQGEVTFDEHWVRFTPDAYDGHDLSCLVPVGLQSQLPLKALENRANGSPDRLLDQFAADLTRALPNISRASATIERYLTSVRRAALREIKLARGLGADLQLNHLSPKPTFAWHLAQSSWQEAAHHVIALVGIRRLDFALLSEIDEFIVEEPEDLAAEIMERREAQLERQARRADLRARGADLETDEMTLRILGHLGLDAAALLRQAAVDQCVQMGVQDTGRSGRLTLIASGGRVGSTLELEGRPRWTDGILEVPKDLLDPEHPPKPGYLIGPQAGLPIFRGLVVSEVNELAGASVTLVHVNKRTVLFDAITGRTWSEEPLVA